MSQYTPINGSHAIEQAVVGIRLWRPVGDAEFAAAIELAAKLAAVGDRLPGRLQVDPMSLVFGRQAITTGYVKSLESQPGVLFHRVSRDGSMEEELTVERTAVTFRTRQYRRWDDMAECINALLIPVAQVLSANQISNLAVVELRCIDRFATEDLNIPLSALIRSDSPHVPQNALSRSDMLHVHTGWFENTSAAGRTLININIDVADEGRRSATILQIVSKQSSGEGRIFGNDGNFSETISSEFTALHLIDKELLSELLTDELQAAISLVGNRGTKRK